MDNICGGACKAISDFSRSIPSGSLMPEMITLQCLVLPFPTFGYLHNLLHFCSITDENRRFFIETSVILNVRF